MAGYLIGVSDFKFEEFLLLIVGGFLVTGSANGFNQILEQDYDKLMIRTSERPLPKKKISSSSAIIFSIIIGIIGFYFLSLIKPHTSFYGEIEHIQTTRGDLNYIYYIWSDYDKSTWISIFKIDFPPADYAGSHRFFLENGFKVIF
jgi:hypothetical protein